MVSIWVQSALPTHLFRMFVSDSTVQHVLQHEIAINGSIPQPTPDTLDFIYLPTGVAAIGPGGDQSCNQMCGYHFDIGSRIFYAVMPYPRCNGCVGDIHDCDVLFERKIQDVTEGLNPDCFNWLYNNIASTNKEIAITIATYIMSMKTEIKLSDYYRRDTITVLSRFLMYLKMRRVRLPIIYLITLRPPIMILS
jgi:hypothetical protein